MTPPALAIHLFGPLRLEADGRPLPASGRREVDRLLALLLVLGAPATRAALAARLWPDDEPARARVRLRQALHYLRHHLPPEGAEPWLRAAGDDVSWNPSAAAWCDVAAYRRAAAAPLQAQREGRPLDVRAVERVVALASAPLLEGMDDPWVVDERARIGAEVGALREALARQRLEVGDAASALREALAVVDADPSREGAWRLAIRACLAQGEAARALELARAAEARLREVAGVEPSPETRALIAEALRPAAPRLDPPAGASAPAIGGGADAAALPERPSVLVSTSLGRALASLLAAHRLVGVVGPPGAGKSWLVLDAARHVAARGERAWWVDAGAAPGALDGLEALANAARGDAALLVLDHVDRDPGAAEAKALRLLQLAPGLRVALVGRAPPGAHGAAVFPLPALGAPAGAAADEAFLDHAERLLAGALSAHRRGAGPSREAADAPDAGRIVRAVDGLALAVVRAAAWCADHPGEALGDRLEDDLAVLDQARPAAAFRAEALGAALEAGHAALAAEERAVLRRLAAIPAAFTMETAMRVGGGAALDVAPDAVPSVVERLAARALVVGEPGRGGPPRFRLLRPVRWHARAKLAEAGEAGAVAALWLASAAADGTSGAA